MSSRGQVISRYESKYLISEDTAHRIADEIRGICSPDKHVEADGRYMVNNLYFETADKRFYYDTRFKRYTRFKPRVRFYGKEPDGFLWLELKHKVKNVTWKIRRRLDVSEWPESIIRLEQSSPGVETLTLVNSFEDAVLRFQAHPIIHVQYIREPYVSDLEDYCRITFDRRLSYRPARGSYDLLSDEPMIYYDNGVHTRFHADDSPVILEIKTETNVPSWVVGLIRRFDLIQQGFSKYCNSLECAMNSVGADDRIACIDF